MKTIRNKKFCLFGGVTCSAILIVCLICGIMQGKIVKASCNTHTGYITEELSWKEYRTNEKKANGYYTSYPTSKQGAEWMFAGWYEDTACKTPLRDGYENDTAVAKFVPAHVLGVKAQVSSELLTGAITENTTGNMRFVTSLDSVNYRKIGINVELPSGKTLQSKQTTVYEKLYAVDSEEQVLSYKASDLFCTMSKYFKAYTIKGIPSSVFDSEFKATPYWITQDGTLVNGETVSKTVKQGIEEAVTVTVKESENGKIVTDMDRYSVGDVVVLNVTPNEGYDCTAVWVNDKEILPKEDDTYNFVATEKTYTVKATFERKIFADGSGWDTSRQHEGLITLPGGGNNSNLKFAEKYTDMDLTLTLKEQSSEPGYHRTTVVYKFEDEKTMNFSFLHNTWNNNGTTVHEYLIQTQPSNAIPGAIMGQTALYNFATDATKVNKYNGEGLDFRIVKDGAKFYLYVDNQLVTLTYKDPTTKENSTCMDLSKVITGSTEAEVSIFHWEGENKDYAENENGDLTIPFSVGTKVFADSAGWDTSKQHEGQITLPGGGDNYKPGLKFNDKYDDMDLTLTLKEQSSKAGYHRTTVVYKFADGKTMNFSFLHNTWGDPVHDEYRVQSQSTDIIPNPILGQEALYDFSKDTAKVEKYDSTGLDFRIVKDGAKFYLYVDNKLVTLSYTDPITKSKVNNSCMDLSKVITGNTEAEVSILHWKGADTTASENDSGDLTIPFTVKKLVNLKGATAGNGTVNIDSTASSVGDDITLKVKPDAGYVCTGLKVDGKEVTLGTDGTYTISNAKESYKVEATYKRNIFADGSGWDTSKQHEGQITLPGGGDNYNPGLKFNDKYDDMDLTLTLKEQSSKAGYHRTTVVYKFADGKTMNFSFLHNTWSVYDYYIIQVQPTIDGVIQNSLFKDYTTLYDFIEDSKKVDKYNGEGLDFRIVKDGAKFYLYVDNQLVTLNYKDPTTKESSTCMDLSKVITGNTEAEVSILHWQGANKDKAENTNGDLTIPFSVKKSVTLRGLLQGNGIVTTDKQGYFVGDKVTLTVHPNTGYKCTSLKVNGKELTANEDGTYSFIAEEETYNVVTTYG